MEFKNVKKTSWAELSQVSLNKCYAFPRWEGRYGFAFPASREGLGRMFFTHQSVRISHRKCLRLIETLECFWSRQLKRHLTLCLEPHKFCRVLHYQTWWGYLISKVFIYLFIITVMVCIDWGNIQFTYIGQECWIGWEADISPSLVKVLVSTFFF